MLTNHLLYKDILSAFQATFQSVLPVGLDLTSMGLYLFFKYIYKYIYMRMHPSDFAERTKRGKACVFANVFNELSKKLLLF